MIPLWLHALTVCVGALSSGLAAHYYSSGSYFMAGTTGFVAVLMVINLIRFGGTR